MDEPKYPFDSAESEGVPSEKQVSNYPRKDAEVSPDPSLLKARKLCRDLLIFAPAMGAGVVVAYAVLFVIDQLFGEVLGPFLGPIALLVWPLAIWLSVAGIYRLVGSDSFKFLKFKRKNPR